MSLVTARLRIAVLTGGDSPQRKVNLACGEQALASLQEAGHRAVVFDLSTTTIDAIRWSGFDACFLALNDAACENARLQERLEALHMPFIGSTSRASRLAASKSACKERLSQSRVPTSAYVLLSREDKPAEIARKTASLPYPCVVKPDSQSSSIGVTVARDLDELCSSVRVAAQFDAYILVEPFIIGREFSATVFGRQMLPLVEIVTPREIFDYEAKYESAMTEFRTEIPLANTVLSHIEELAVQATEAVETRGLARVDVIVDRHGRSYVLEVNTLPSIAAHSLAAASAARAGLTVTALCDWMIEECLTSEVSR